MTAIAAAAGSATGKPHFIPPSRATESILAAHYDIQDMQRALNPYAWLATHAHFI